MLIEMEAEPMIEEELLAARLYTGPCFLKYNAVLRSKSGAGELAQRCAELCRGNQYPTTIHAINSCVIKLSKLTVATKVYRGLKGAALPANFFTPDEHGVCGGVEFGFMSTTLNKAVAAMYLGRGGILLEILVETALGWWHLRFNSDASIYDPAFGNHPAGGAQADATNAGGAKGDDAKDTDGGHADGKNDADAAHEGAMKTGDEAQLPSSLASAAIARSVKGTL